MIGCDLNDAIDSLGFGLFDVKLLSVIGLLKMADGIELTLTAFLAPYIKCKFNLTSAETALNSSLVFLGMGVGSLYWGWLADQYGRKKVVLLLGFLLSYFGLLSASTSSFYWFVILRYFVGFSVGGVIMGPLYIMEYMSISTRAKGSCVLEIFFSCGSIFTTLMALLTLNTYGYRALLLTATIPVIISFISMLWLPESLHHLQNNGETYEIIEILRYMSDQNRKPLPESIDIKGKVTLQHGRIRELFGKQHVWIMMKITIIWSIILTLYFGVLLLTTQIYLNENSFEGKTCRKFTTAEIVSSGLTVLGDIFGQIASILIVDRIGRKRLLCTLYIGVMFFFGLLFIDVQYIRSICLFFLRGIVSPLCSIFFVYTLEVLPTTIRSTGLGFSHTFARWTLIFVPFIVQWLIFVSFAGMLGVFIGISALGLITTMSLKKDTTGAKLQRM